MKKITLLVAFSLSVLSGCAPKSKEADADVTPIIKESFSKQFAGATDVKWTKESDSEFEAEFRIGKINKSANFDQFGKWLITETEIDQAELPAAVQMTVKNEFAGYSIEEVELAEPSGGSIYYEIVLESGEVNFEIQISPEGKVLKKEEMKEKDETDEKD